MGEGKDELTPTPRPVKEPVGVAEPVDDITEPEEQETEEAAGEADETETPYASITPPSILEPESTGPDNEPDKG